MSVLRRSLPALIALPVIGGAAVTYTLGTQKVRRQASTHRTYWGSRPEACDDGTFRLVVLGDSTAQGVGVVDPARGYVGIVEARLATALHRPVLTTNLSVSGATSVDLVADQLPLLAALPFTPDLVICVIGSNDIIKRTYEPTGFAERIDTIAAALPPGSVLGEVPSFGHPPWEPRVLRVNPLVRDAAERYGHQVASVHEATRALWPLRIVQHVARDLFHPNQRGYEVWAGAVWQGVAAALLERGLVAGDAVAGDPVPADTVASADRTGSPAGVAASGSGTRSPAAAVTAG